MAVKTERRCEAKDALIQVTSIQSQGQSVASQVCAHLQDAANCDILKANNVSIDDIVVRFKKVVAGKRCKLSGSDRMQLGFAAQTNKNSTAIAGLVTEKIAIQAGLGTLQKRYDALVDRFNTLAGIIRGHIENVKTYASTPHQSVEVSAPPSEELSNPSPSYLFSFDNLRFANLRYTT